MRESLIYPVTPEYVYTQMYGPELYNGKGARPELFEIAQAVARVCNDAFSVGENNGRANVDRRREYVRACFWGMIKADNKKASCRKLYKPMLSLIDMGYKDGFRKGRQERGDKTMVAIIQTIIICITVVLCVAIVIVGRDNRKK